MMAMEQIGSISDILEKPEQKKDYNGVARVLAVQ